MNSKIEMTFYSSAFASLLLCALAIFYPTKSDWRATCFLIGVIGLVLFPILMVVSYSVVAFQEFLSSPIARGRTASTAVASADPIRHTKEDAWIIESEERLQGEDESFDLEPFELEPRGRSLFRPLGVREVSQPTNSTDSVNENGARPQGGSPFVKIGGGKGEPWPMD